MKTHHLSYSVRRYFVDEFYFRHVSILSSNSQVLDLGGNRVHKRGRFDIEKYHMNVIYTNLSTIKQPNIQADAAHIPFGDNQFDAVICAELLEHVFSPPMILREAHRILNSRGSLLISVPFLYHIHGDPYDFGRYTDHYWQSVLEEIGFEEIVIERQGLFFSVLANFLKLYANRMYRRPIRDLVSLPLSLFQWWALKREQNPSIQSHPFLNSFTTGFGIVARKSRNHSLSQ
jgi:SAM-dependent methyltransferase